MEWIPVDIIFYMHQSFEKMETQEVRVELSRARDAAHAISARMAKVLDQNRNATYRKSEAEKTGQDSFENVIRKKIQSLKRKNRNPEDNIEKKHTEKFGKGECKMSSDTITLELDKYESGVVFHSLKDKRNQMLKEGKGC